MEKEINKRVSPKDVVGFAIPALLTMAIVGGFIATCSRNNANKDAGIEAEKIILKDLGLSKTVPLVDYQGYSIYVRLGEIDPVRFSVKTQQNDGTTRDIEVIVPVENIDPVVAEDPNAKPTVLFKPDNFIEQKPLRIFPIKELISDYIITNSSNSSVLNPIGKVAISLSRKDHASFLRAKNKLRFFWQK